MSEQEKKRPEPTAIPVRVLNFPKDFDALHVGIDMKASVNAEAEPRYKLTYFPDLRHHKIEYTLEAKQPPRVSYVHESQVLSWVPVP